MWIEGFSCLGLFGAGPEALLAAMHSNTALAARADTTELKNHLPAKSLRHCDHFSRMALLGAFGAVEDAGLSPASLGSCGIVLASGFGPTKPTFDFLDSVIDFGEAMASPLAFSHSVHIIPAAIIAKNMHIVGPCSAVCQFESAFTSGLMVARTWLTEGRVERVLFGAVEELTPTLHYMLEDFGPASPVGGVTVLGEGAVFFCLASKQGKSVARISTVSVESAPTPLAVSSPAANTMPHGVDMLRCSGTVFGKRIGDSAAYGLMPIAQAFDCAVAVARVQKGLIRTAQCDNQAGGVHSSVVISRGSNV